MKLELRFDERLRTVELERDPQGSLRIQIDGRAVDADVRQVAPGIYSILLHGRSFEARVEPKRDGLVVECGGAASHIQVRDPRAWHGRHGSVLATEGRQQVTAPMPGKVVRLLVAAGEHVEAGQGLAIVEAMKMQNEIRAPKSGKIEGVFVKENQAVSAGEPLAVIA